MQLPLLWRAGRGMVALSHHHDRPARFLAHGLACCWVELAGRKVHAFFFISVEKITAKEKSTVTEANSASTKIIA